MRNNDSRQVKNRLKEVICGCCNGLGEVSMGDEWTGPYYENCTTCKTTGMVLVYKGFKVIDTLTEEVA